MAWGIPNKADALYARQAGVFSADMDTIAAALAGDGVLSGMGVSAQGSPDMTVAVAAGLVRIGGWFAYYAGANVAIAAADSTLKRIDLIVVDRNGAVSRVAGTAAAKPVPPAVPANSVQLAQVYVDAAVAAIVAGAIKDKRFTVADYYDFGDEFTPGALVTTGNISSGAWGTTGATPGTMAFQSGEASHPGIVRLVTGTASGNNQRIHLGTSATAGLPIVATDIARVRAIVRIPTITTLAVKLGLGLDLSDAAAGSLGTAGAWWEYVPATSAKWRVSTRNASASTTNADTGADVAANTWYQLDMVRRQDGAWQFARNGVLLFTHTTNQPTVAVTLGALVHTLAAAARSLDIDLLAGNYAPMGNRWT